MPKPRRNKKRGAGNGAAPQQKTQKTAKPTTKPAQAQSDPNPPETTVGLSPRDRAIVARLIQEPTLSDRELSAELGIDRKAIAAVKDRPEVRRVLDYYQLSTVELLIRARQKAARKLNSLVDSSDPVIAARVGLGLLRISPATAANERASSGDTNKITVVIENRAALTGEEDAVVQEKPPSKSESISPISTTERSTPASGSSTPPASDSKDTPAL